MRRFLIGLAVLIGLLAIGTYLTPRMIHVEREIEAAAAPAKVYAIINGFKRFPEWSPWQEKDPGMQQTWSGPEAGVGASMSWKSDKADVGSGTQKIVAVKANEEVLVEVDMVDMGQIKAFLRLQPTNGGQGTRIVWGADSDLGMNPVSRWMGFWIDDWVAADYDKGLAKLKALAEKP